MAQTSSIEWTEKTWNPVTGCSRVSPGCDNCYAETLTARFAGRPGYIEEHRPWTPENAAHNVRLHPERLEQPLKWRKPAVVFVNSMSDLFHEQIPLDFLAAIWDVMARTPQHTYQVLTKRPQRIPAALGPNGIGFYAVEGPVLLPQPNVWLGTSIESWRFNYRADQIRRAPAAIRFISAEPLLDTLLPADRPERCLDLTGIDWLIVGGESGGRDARPMHPEWARELRDAALDVCGTCLSHESVYHECSQRPALFFKQWGSWSPFVTGGTQVGDVCLSEDGERYDVDEDYVCAPNESDGVWMRYVGASPKSGGRRLDGREWNEMPTFGVPPKHRFTQEALL